MRAWGSRSFENEAARDWAEEMFEHGLPLVEATLDKTLAVESKYLTIHDSEVAIAACEVIARLFGGYFLPCPDSVKVVRWVDENNQEVQTATAQKAIAVIDNILSRPNGIFAKWQTGYFKSCWQTNILSIREQIFVKVSAQ